MEIKEIIAKAIGEASMCWDKTPKGIFDSNEAENIVKKVIQKIEIINFAEARKLMNETLLKDKDIYYGYQSNIAMLLHDEQVRNVDKPIDYKDHVNRNEIAQKILKLIFS
jgi:hypothetical protein